MSLPAESDSERVDVGPRISIAPPAVIEISRPALTPIGPVSDSGPASVLRVTSPLAAVISEPIVSVPTLVVSDCLGCQAEYGSWARTSRALALRRTRSLWARAIRITFFGLPARVSRRWKAAKSGLCRRTSSATTNRIERMPLRPPRTERLPLSLPLSRAIGARPASLLTALLERVPISGNSAISLTASETYKLWVTIQATLKRVVLGGTGHERGPAETVRGLCRGTRRGDRARGSGGAI